MNVSARETVNEMINKLLVSGVRERERARAWKTTTTTININNCTTYTLICYNVRCTCLVDFVVWRYVRFVSHCYKFHGMAICNCVLDLTVRRTKHGEQAGWLFMYARAFVVRRMRCCIPSRRMYYQHWHMYAVRTYNAAHNRQPYILYGFGIYIYVCVSHHT